MPMADKRLTLEHEKVLWNSKELDLDTSKGLLRAVIFYLIKCFAVWQSKELRHLQTSHISFGEDRFGKYVALDLQASIFRRKRVVKRYDDPANPRSVYKILKKYQSRIANEGPFLVRPITSIKDFVCFGPLPIGVKVIKTFISTLMEDAGIGRCFANYSLNLLSIDTLMRFGTGFHCLSSWLVKNNEKCFPSSPVCSSANCEEINPEVSVMLSRLLDAPCPFDAVDIIQKMEEEEKQRSKNSDLLPKFDSWMTNLMEKNTEKEKECEQNPKFPSVVCADLEVREKESSSDNESSSKVNIEFTNLNGKMVSNDGKSLVKDKCTSQTESDKSGLKIMTVSSITEDAFSLQVNEGVLNNDDEDKIDKSLQLHTHLDRERMKMKDIDFKSKSSSGKKRKNIRSECEREFDEVVAKATKFNDNDSNKNSHVLCKELNLMYAEKKKKDSAIKSITDIKIEQTTETISSHEIVTMNGLKKDEIETFQNGQTVVIDTRQNNCVSTSLMSGSVKGLESPKKEPVSTKVSSTSHKFGLPNPNSSRDSITILRMLLHQQSNDEKKTHDRSNSVTKRTDEIKCAQQCNSSDGEQNYLITHDDEDKSEEDHSGNISDEHESIVNSDDCDEDKQMMIDLSPPTLSPQPLTSSHDFKDALTNQNSGTNSLSNPSSPSSSCALNLMSSDIVQFLDKAHQQIKDILKATSSKNIKQNRNGECGLKSIVPGQLEIDVASRKSGNPTKIISSSSAESASRQFEGNTRESIIHTSLKSSQPVEQLQSQFPLLRLFLEKPIEESEIAVSSQSTLNTTLQPKDIQQKPSPFHSSSQLDAQSEVTEPPKLTYMGNVTISKEASRIEDDTHNLKLDHDGIDEKSKFEEDNVNRKRKCSNSASSLVFNKKYPDIDLSHVSPSHSPLSMPSLPASPSTSLDCQQSNSAEYHVEKDLINNAVYQTLHVNYEKDGMRTFTFADIPNVPETSSQSKKFQGSKQTSEINLGDYFPPGALIPAKDIHLMTQQGSDGCDIVMKFKFYQKN